ncbi:uncharacterized protein LOC135815120 isoform X2 [Sycon ciliatum]|uniref:uncharacterized protein LOC135815120 isoform X2 n=1 Tax=Sycon ciliatum TaxID=27933 RepID=UPI0031F6C31B
MYIKMEQSKACQEQLLPVGEDPLYSPPAKKRKAASRDGRSATNPVCVDDSSGDETSQGTPKNDVESTTQSSSDDFRRPSIRHTTKPVRLNRRSSISPSVSSTTSNAYPLKQQALFIAEKVCVGTLPGVVVGEVCVEGEGLQSSIRFRMAVEVDDNDFAVTVQLKTVIKWDYGACTEPTTHLLRLRLTPAGATQMRTRTPAIFKKEVLNPEMCDDLAYVTFFLPAPLSESEQLNMQSIADSCNAKLSPETWSMMSASHVIAFTDSLSVRGEGAIKAVADARSQQASLGAKPYMSQPESFYGSSSVASSTTPSLSDPWSSPIRRSTRRSTRVNTLHTDYEFNVPARVSSKVSSSISTLPQDYVKPIPDDNPRELLTYPPLPQTGGITVTSNDLLCLQPQEFLNDIIIDFYLKYLFHELPEEKQAKVHMFNSFFYRRLTQRQAGGSTRSAAKSGGLVGISNSHQEMHDRVKKWTRNVDIFDKDFVFIPINEHAHWYLAVICFPGADGPVFESKQSVNTAADVSPMDMDADHAEHSHNHNGVSTGGSHSALSSPSDAEEVPDEDTRDSDDGSPLVRTLNPVVITDVPSQDRYGASSPSDSRMDTSPTTPETSSVSARNYSRQILSDGDSDSDDDGLERMDEEVLTPCTGAPAADAWDTSGECDGDQDENGEESEESDEEKYMSTTETISNAAQAQLHRTTSTVLVDDSLDSILTIDDSSTHTTSSRAVVSVDDAVLVCSESSSPPPLITISKSLGRTIVLRTNEERDRLDANFSFFANQDSVTCDVDAATATAAAAASTETLPDKSDVQNWPHCYDFDKPATEEDEVARPASTLKRRRNGRGLRKPAIKSQPCILLFDSLGSRYRNRVIANLRSYLAEEWAARKGSPRPFNAATMKSGYPKVPQQDNFCDCGVFVLQYVESMLQSPIQNYRLPLHIADWFSQETVGRKRQDIISLIQRLEQESVGAARDTS